jgi:hypothetical protein
MSGVPPQQPPVSICEECEQQKKTATREVSFSSTSSGSKTKHHQGKIDYGGTTGGTDRENTQTTSTGRTVKRTENFFICPTEGCVQRKMDRWKAREWELRNDPELNNSSDYRSQEKQRINEEEERLRGDREEFRNQNQTTRIGTRKNGKADSRQQNEEEYQSTSNETKTTASRQSTRDSARQSERRSRDSDGRRSEDQTNTAGWGSDTSSRSDEQTNATGWGSNTSTQSEDQATAAATGWGADDSSRSNEKSTEQQNNFQDELDMTGAETTAQGNEAFEQNVNANDANTTKQHQEDMHENLDPEAVEEDQSETVNRSRNTSYSQSRRRR